jgi:two-component system OmpR family response regulator
VEVVLTTAHLLVVDADAQEREFLHRHLSDSGFSVETATCAREMTRRLMAAGRPPDLVLMDPFLPGHDEWHLPRELRNCCEVPLVLLSSRAAAADRVKGLELGADDFIAKPFVPRELVARIHNVLRRVRRQVPVIEFEHSLFSDWSLDLPTHRLEQHACLQHVVKHDETIRR